MAHPLKNPSIMTHRRLLLFKWLMILIPPMTVAIGHSLPDHAPGGRAAPLIVTSLVTLLAVVLSYIFVETLFKVLRRLQVEALAREQDILTMNSVMRERERLGRELHDGAAQLVAHLLLRLDTIKELVEADRQQEAEAELERLHEVADELYEDIGESITGTRTNVAERGLSHTLRDYADQFEGRHHIPVSLRTDEAVDRLSPLAAFQLFRFVQEALTNVRKHAEAREATVTLASSEPGWLTVVIADDGHGFSLGGRGGTTQSLGLTSMRERIETLSGIFQVTSQPGSGTNVTATIPIPGTRKENGHAPPATPPG